jgi:competence protein ComEA
MRDTGTGQEMLRGTKAFPWKSLGRPGMLLLLLIALCACRNPSLAITAAPLPTLTLVAPSPAPLPVQVSVDGAVKAPGTYTLPPGSRVDDAVHAAGGPSSVADLERINLAQALQSGHRIHVPRYGEVLPTPTPCGLSTDGRIDINLADAALLESLPGIGEALAQRIITYRETQGPFGSVEELLAVRGIGPVILEEIRERIAAGQPD